MNRDTFFLLMITFIDHIIIYVLKLLTSKMNSRAKFIFNPYYLCVKTSYIDIYYKGIDIYESDEHP